MTREERENALYCLKVMVGEEVCEECKLYGSTGTDHCEDDCVRIAIKVLEQEPKTDVLDKIRAEIVELRSKQNVGVLECLDIIDKYKTESEG